MLKTPGGVLLPPNVKSVEPRPYVCRICRAALKESERVPHAMSCANRHEDELREMSLRTKAPWILEPLDPELDAWIKENIEAIEEGRKRFGTPG